MSRLLLQSQVVYMPGSWGAAVPVSGATIEIIDIDQPGKGDDVIWSGRTDAQGRFSGTSGEWRDSTTQRVLIPDSLWSAHWEDRSVADLTDMLSLQAHVMDGERETWLPFFYLNDNVPSPSLVVPWSPAGQTLTTIFELPLPAFIPQPGPLFIASVDGVGCLSPVDVNARLRAAIAARRDSIRVEVYGPDGALLSSLTDEPDDLTDWAGDRLGIPVKWRPARQPWADDGAAPLSVGCALVKTSIGVSPVLLCVGLALIYAVNHGYRDIQVGTAEGVVGAVRAGVRFTARR